MIIFKICCMVLGVIFPFAVYWGIIQNATVTVAVMLVCLGLGNLLSAGRNGMSGKTAVLVFVLDILLAAVFLLSGDFLAVKLYPLMVNGCFLSVFASSLTGGRTPVIEKIASYTVKEEDRDDFFRMYCRRVTAAWCIFFVVNGMISLATALWGSNEVWMLYNGVISYILIGTVFTVEYIIRIILRRRNSRTNDTKEL